MGIVNYHAEQMGNVNYHAHLLGMGVPRRFSVTVGHSDAIAAIRKGTRKLHHDR